MKHLLWIVLFISGCSTPTVQLKHWPVVRCAIFGDPGLIVLTFENSTIDDAYDQTNLVKSRLVTANVVKPDAEVQCVKDKVL